MDAPGIDVISLPLIDTVDLALRIAVLCVVVYLLRRGGLVKAVAIAALLMTSVGCSHIGYGYVNINIAPIGVSLELHGENIERDPQPTKAEASADIAKD